MDRPSTSKQRWTRLEDSNTPRSRKRTASGGFTNTGRGIRHGSFLQDRQPFDKKLFINTLEFLAKCENPLCDPLFRRFRGQINMCDRCTPRLIALHHRLVFTENLAKLHENAYRAFEYVAQVASSLDYGDSFKDKRVLSFVHMQNVAKLAASLIKHVCLISDTDYQMLQTCSEASFLIVDLTRKNKMGFGDCQVKTCYNSREVLVTLKANSYDPKTFKPIKSSGEKTNYCICKFHAFAFRSIHRLNHTFYNAHQNFCYWIEQSKEELSESFDSKLKMDFTMDFGDNGKQQTGTINFLEVQQELLQNLTTDFVNLFIELDGKSKFTEQPIFSGIWIARMIRLKSNRLLELAQKLAPQLLKKIDESRAKHNFSNRARFAHLIYKDPD